MAEEIIISYKVDTTGLDKAVLAVDKVTEATGDLQQKIKVAFTQKELDQAVQKLEDMGMSVDALVLKYGSAQKAFKGATKELIDMAAAGQQGTKEFKDLEKSAAQLQDTISDTRNSIKRLSSDTRLIDTVAQGMRGLAAAGSVVTGVMATFGSENQQVQKTLLQVQGAMATLQGIQELANIATEQGGIATKAYGAALLVVDKISKVTGASMAASWALATAGITVVVGAIIGLIYWLTKEQETEEQIAARKKELAEIEALRASQSETEIKNRMKLRDNEYKQRLLLATTDIQRLKIQIERENELKNSIEARLKGQKAAAESIKQAYGEENAQYVALKNSILQGESEVLDAKTKIRDIQKQINDIGAKEAKEIADKNAANDRAVAEEQEKMRLEYLAQKEKEIADARKMNDEERAAELQAEKDFAIKQGQQAAEYLKMRTDAEKAAAEERVKIEQGVYNAISSSLSSISSLASNIFANQSASLEASKEKELKVAGDNAEARKKIEQKYAIESAKIARKQAQLQKAVALVQIAVDIAKAITAITAQATTLSANPITAALSGLSYAQLGIAIGAGIAQAAAIASAPLPEIPQFEKGGPVPIKQGLLQGRSHREGGVLINAQGGEYIWDIPTVKKHGDIIRAAHENRLDDLILHQYVAPLLQQSLAATSAHSEYDDFMLRATIKQGHEKDRRNAEYIADKVSGAVTASMFNKNRYQ